MVSDAVGKVAVLWRGDRRARDEATPQNNRFHSIFEALAAAGVRAEPAVYAEEMADEVRAQLLKADGVLVWVDPLSDGLNRRHLDELLRDVASHGIWISAHPDITMKMGVKEVLHTAKHLGWGTDTKIYRTFEAFREQFPGCLRSTGPRVVKQNRGNGGQGVWKVDGLPGEGHGRMVCVLEARRGSELQTLPLSVFMESCERYFSGNGLIVDQPFQERLPEGMIRCYMGADKVVGFGHQLIKALLPPPPEGASSLEAQPGPRIMHPAAAPEFQALRSKMDDDWAGNRDFWFFGAAVWRQVGDNVHLGVELFNQTASVTGGRSSTGANVGVVFDLSDNWHLLNSVGTGLLNRSITNRFSWYAALQLTF